MRKSVAIFAILLLSAIPIVMLASCATTIIPPEQPANPVTIHLIDQGRTPTLILPRDDGTCVRYVYGDWEYYALRHNDIFHGIAALFWPTQGALGRKVISQPASVDEMFRSFGINGEEIFSMQVEHESVQQLCKKLDQVFRDNAHSQVRNEAYGLKFVHHPKRYTIFGNSNHMTAQWLRDLGCETRGPAILSQWRIRSSQ